MWTTARRCTAPAAFDRNEVRDVRRTTLAGDAPTVAQGL